MIKSLRALAILCLVSSFSLHGLAQAPVASFSASKTSGCSPVVVQFTDLSTGGPTSWHWDLGNGGTSTLQNPAATYITPGTYTVILTATNSNGSTKDTNYITVHTSPTVAFTTDTTSVCGNKTVTFTNNTIPGAGGAVSYFWDFGDGDTSSTVSPTHTYTYAGSFSVSLVVVNSNGCTNTLTKNNYINILPKSTTAFAADNTSSCAAPFQVNFTNTTTGGISYAWNFGDGNTSTAVNPSNTYASPGTYNVRLITTGNNGCKDTLTKSSYIVIGQVNADFTTSSPVCVGQSVTFTNTTTPGAGISRLWNFGNGGTDTAVNPVYQYSTAGTYTVTLIEQYANSCNDTISKSVTVNAKPTAGFTSADTVGCSVPFSASFTNSSTGATTYAWSSGSSTSTATNPSLVYNSLGVYNVRLVAINAAGCRDTFTRNNYIKLQAPQATLAASPDSTCANTPVQFTASLVAPLYATNYRWDFGDGSSVVNCASCNTQTHTYSSNGSYTVQLIVTTATGCYDTVVKAITVSSKPTASFTGSPLTVCPDATVSFTNNSTGATSYLWQFGDGHTATTTNPGHTYNSTGTYTVSLIASNNGCKDTQTRSNYINVQLPHADFTPTFQCSARMTYTFLDSSIGANTYDWDFGDGNSSSTAGNVTHTYAAAGTYNVELRVYNTTTGCYDTMTQTINVTQLTTPDFYALDTTICRNQDITLIRDAATGVTFRWVIGPTVSNVQGHAASYTLNLLGAIDVKLVVTDSFGCKDSLIKPGYLKYGGANVDFTASTLNPCKNASLTFDDVSTMGAFAVTNRLWDFGDGTQVNTVSDPTSHSFNNTGPYTIKLVVTDANGCKDSLTKTNYVYAHKPTAQFYSNDTIVCAGDTVKFENNSGGTSFISFWDFGDGNTITESAPEHVYTMLGNYTVKLTITDTFGCKDSVIKTDYIEVQKPTAAFTMSDSVANCPPLTVHMTNTSTNGASYAWTFGNGNQSSFVSPSTTYTYPGVYTVKLVATNVAGCKDSTTKTVTVNGPTGSYSYTPLAGCKPLTVQFTATSSNTTTYIWDMNNGFTQNTGTGSFSYTYTQTGRYVPKLILSDGASCQVPIQNTDTVIVDEIISDFAFTAAGNLCNTDTVYFNDTVLTSISDITSRSWDFGDGGTSTAEDPSHYYNTPGTYQVNLIITNATGCKDTITKTVTIFGLPTVVISAAADSICPGQPTGVQLNSSGASTYTWTPAIGLTCTNCANPIANPQTTTTYIVTGTDTNGCTNNDTVTIHLKAKPTLTIAGDSSICEGETTQLTASGADSYIWSPNTALSCAPCANPVASPTTTTGYTVIGTNGSGCKDTATVTITVLPKPTVTTNGNKTICVNDTALLIAGGADSYTWLPNTALSCNTCDSTLAYPATTTVYSVIGTAANSCKDTATVTVTVNPLPVVNAGSDKAICIGGSTTLSATGAASFTWTPATGLSNPGIANPTANPTATTTYIVTGINGNNCSDQDTVVVTVNPLPTVSAGTDKTICAGFSATLQATGAASYTWAPATALSNPNIANPIATPATTTAYTVTGTDGNGCKNTDTVTVFVNPQPTVSGGTDKNICPGDSVQLQATGATSYVWSPATGLSNVNIANPKASPATTTTYTVVGTDGNGCKDTATVVVNVNPIPVVNAGSDKAICIGSSTTLSATGAVSYTWSPATGLSNPNIANPVANPTTTTTYIVTGINGSSCSDQDTVVVTVNALPTVSAGADKTVCAGFSTALQATGATSYTWAPTTGLSNPNIANPTATPATTTTYIVTGTDGNTCQNTDTVTVFVNPQPGVSGGTNKAVCMDDSAQLQATGATTYVWSPLTGLSNSTIANPKASPATTTTYTVVGTDGNGCKDTATVTVTVNSLPTVNAGADKAICIGSSTTLSASGAVSYTWSPATGLSNPNIANPTASSTTTTTYVVTGANGNNCVDQDTVIVTVNPLPNVNAGSAQSICLKDSAQLQATGATTYVWSPATGLSNPNIANPKASPASTTTYTVTGTDANGCVNTSTVTVTIKPLPTISAGNDVAICLGSSVQLQATGAGTGGTYKWVPSTGLSCSNCPDPIAGPVGTTTYIVTGTASNACANTDTVIVKVNPLPMVSAGSDVDICIGDSTQLQATGAATYTWSPATGLSCQGCPSPFAKPAATTTYTTIGVDTNGCKDTASVTVTVKPLPVVTVAAARDLICENDTVQLTATGGAPYSWMPNSGLSCTTCPNPVATLQFPTTFTVTATLNGCTDTAQVFVGVIPKPNVSAGPDKEYCAGGSDTLHASGALTYTWAPATSLSCINCPSPIANPNSTTTYTVTGVDSVGCRASDDVLVTVNPLPDINAGEDLSACQGQPIQLKATGGLNYTWSPAAGLSCTNCTDPMATPDSTMTYTVSGTDANGCTNSDEVTVNVMIKQAVSFSNDDTICIGGETELSASGGTQYIWSPADALSNTEGPAVTAAPGATTRYRVIIKQGDCFTDTGYTTVYVFGPPEIDAGPDHELQGGNEVRLETRSSNVEAYEWTPADGLSCTGCPNPIAAPRRTTRYVITVTSPQGCTAEDDVTIHVTCSGDQLFIANTFTPNNDGVNDMFFPQGKGLTHVQRFSVYSRWGELLFDRTDIPLNDPTYGWDGTYKSEPLKPDVFIYVVRALCEDGQPVEIKGDISLIR